MLLDKIAKTLRNPGFETPEKYLVIAGRLFLKTMKSNNL